VRVSGEHCRVYAEGGRLSITDNGSTNGTFVNERPLAPDELRDLVPGDIIRLGEDTRIEVTGDDIAVMKTLAGDAGMLAREIAAAAAKPLRPAPVQRAVRQQPAEPTVEVECSCGQKLFAREKYAGVRVRCPSCRNVLQVPGRPALAQPVIEEAPAPPVAVPARLWGRAVKFAASILLMIAVGASVSALFASARKSSDGSRKAAVEDARRSAAP
jgi:hypothetical protein